MNATDPTLPRGQALFPVSPPEMLTEVERELEVRRRVYPRWVRQGKLSQARADRQLELMEAVAELLRAQPVQRPGGGP